MRTRLQGMVRRRTTRWAVGALIAASLALPNAALAAHNDFNSPNRVVLGYDYDDDNTGANTQTGEPLIAGSADTCDDSGQQMGSTLWYRFTGTGRPVTVETFDNNFDTMVAVYARSLSPTPTSASLLGCDDDSGGPGGASLLEVPTVAGNEYLVQVGGFDATGATLPQEGQFSFAATSYPPNDDRARAESLGAGPPFVGDNRGAVTETGEDVVCEADANAPLGKTVWTKFQVGEEGDASLTASGFDTVMQIYRAGDPAPFACNDDGQTGSVGPSRLSLRLTPGEYFVQIGGYGSEDAASDGDLTLQLNFTIDPDLDDDGSNRPQDCNDRNAGIRPGAADVPENGVDEDCSGADAIRLDRDGDGFNAPQDCNDGNAGVRPGAPDVPGNGIDENCNGADDRASLIVGGYGYNVARDGLTLKSLTARRVAPGMNIAVSCRGRRCFKAFAAVPKKSGDMQLIGRIPRKRRKVSSGAVVTIRITQPGTIGKLISLVLRKGKPVSEKRQCLAVTTNKRIKCPTGANT
jgi:hypothetical protein